MGAGDTFKRWKIVTLRVRDKLDFRRRQYLDVFFKLLMNEFGWAMAETSLAFTILLIFFCDDLAFQIAGVLCAIAVVISLLLRPKK